MVDQVLLARLLFGLTASFHIVFPSLIIGLAIYLAALEIAWLKTKREIYRIQYQFWIKPFTVVFVIGMISGLVLSYELDTFFKDFYYKTAEILIPIRRFELANALILEAGALGIMLCGWKRVGHRLHLLATLMMVVGVLISGVCILARNSWMQTPDGFMLIDGQIVLHDWLSAIINPSFPYRFLHMLGAAMLSTAFFVLGISARFLLKKQHETFAKHSLRTSLLAILVLAPLQIVSGDLHGLNTHQHQPVKLAAMEGLWNTTQGAPLILFAVPDQKAERNRYTLEIPRLASLIVTHDLNGEIKGLKEVPTEERPNVALVFYSFRIMVALGLLMLIVGLIGWYLMRKKRLYHKRRFLRLCYLMTPSGLIATIAGWCVTESGRQPWVVSGLLRTAEVATPLSVSQSMDFLTLIGIAYVLFLGIFMYALVRFIQQGPQENDALIAPASTLTMPRWHERIGISVMAYLQQLFLGTSTRIEQKSDLSPQQGATGVRPIQSHRSFDWSFLRPTASSGVGFALGLLVGAVVVFYAPVRPVSEEITSTKAVLSFQQTESRQIAAKATYPDQESDEYQRDLALARNYANLGSLYFKQGKLKRADSMYRNALIRYEKTRHSAGTADTYSNLGTVYWRRGELDEAQAMYEKALQINEKLGRRQQQARAYANLGVVYQTRGELGRAKDFHYQALRMYESLGGNADAMANTYSNLARLYKSLGNLDRAEAMFLDALDLRQSIESRRAHEMTIGFKANVR